MLRPWVTPSRFSMLASKLGGGRPLLRTCVTGAGIGELGNNVEKIAGSNRPGGKITKHGIIDLSGAGAVAAQAVFILIDGRIDGGHAMGGVDARNAVLRSAS